jgi:dihydroxyacid dehydratase/phosphogluconate dehydratase
MATALAKAKGNSISPGLTRDGWGNRFAMDARAHIKSRLPSRHAAVSDGAANAALHAPAIVQQRGIKFYFAKFDAAEIFKKTPYAADSKPRGRYVAKDRYDVGSLPLLMKTLLDNGHLQRDCLTVTGRPIAETLKSARCNPHHDVVRAGDVVEIEAGVGALNVKLTGAEPTERKTKWKARETNHRSGVLWKVGPGVDGAVAHPGAAYEKQYYADI